VNGGGIGGTQARSMAEWKLWPHVVFLFLFGVGRKAMMLVLCIVGLFHKPEFAETKPDRSMI